MNTQACTATAGAASHLESVFDSLRENHILVPDPDAVADYLVNHPDLPDAVLAACGVAGARLAANAQLSLELYRDNEEGGGELILYVRQQVYEARIMDVIESLRQLTEPHFAGRAADLHITTDFQHPR